MHTRHRFFLFFLALVIGATMAGPPTAFAKGKKINWDFDLVTYDSKYLEEPSGKIRISIELPEAAEDYADVLRDPVWDYLSKERDKIRDYMKDIDKRIEKNPSMKTDKLMKNLNALFKDSIKSAEKGAQKILDDEWKKIVKRDKKLTKAKVIGRLKAGFKAAKGLFGIGTSVASLAGSSGAAVPAYFSLLSSTATFAGGVYDFIKGPTFDSMGKLIGKIGQSSAQLDKKNFRFVKAGDLKASLKELNGTAKSYAKTLSSAEGRHAKLVKRIKKLLNAMEKENKKFKPANKKQASAVKKAEEAVNGVIERAVDVGEYLTAGKAYLKESKTLSKTQASAIKAMSKKTKAEEILAKIIDPANLDKIATGSTQLQKLAQKAMDNSDKIKSGLEDAVKLFQAAF